MIIKIYDINNKEIFMFQQDNSNVIYITNVNTEKSDITGNFSISNIKIDSKTYLKFLQLFTNKTISYFKLIDETSGQPVYISMLFLKNVMISYSMGMLHFRSDIEINQQNMNQYIDFLETHKEI